MVIESKRRMKPMKDKCCIIDDCCCVDCHQSKKEMLECKRSFKKRLKERLDVPKEIAVIRTKVRVDKDFNITEFEFLDD